MYFSGLPSTKLGTYLENRINSFLKKKDAGAGEVTIRVLSSSDKTVEVKPGMKTRYLLFSTFIFAHSNQPFREHCHIEFVHTIPVKKRISNK